MIKNSRFRKIICLSMAIIVMFSLFSLNVYAEDDMNLSHRYVQITNKNGISDKQITKQNTSNYAKSSFAIDDSIAIVDFLEMKDDESILSTVEQLIYNGKFVYVRAEGHLANRTILSKMLPGNDNGTVYATNDESLLSRANTIGYIVFLDTYGGFQCVRLWYSYANNQGKLNENATDNLSTLQSVQETSTKEKSIGDELDFVESALMTFSQDLSSEFNAKVSEVSAQTFNSGKAHYVIVADSVSHVDSSNRVLGVTTKKLYAFRLHPVATNNTGVPTPGSGSGETRWAWKAVYTITPKWSTYKTYIRESDLSLNTFPVDSGSATYKQIIAEYAPTQDLNGSSDVTFTISETPSLSFTAKFKHVNVDILSYRAGYNTANNTIAINYTIPCTLYPAIWSEAKNTVDFTMSAVTINTGNKNACMQFNSSLVLGDAENDTILTWGTSAAAWSLSVR